MKTKVLIIVRSGVVVCVESTQEIEYCVIDWDNIEGGQTEIYSANNLRNQDEIINEQTIKDYFVEANEIIQKNIDFGS